MECSKRHYFLCNCSGLKPASGVLLLLLPPCGGVSMLLANTSCVAFLSNSVLHCTVSFLHGAGRLLESRQINWSRSTPHPCGQNLIFFFIYWSAALSCEGFRTFRELTTSPYSGCAGGLVGCEGFRTFRELTTSPYSGCAGGLVGCEGFRTFRELTASPYSGCAGGLVGCEGFRTFRELTTSSYSGCADGLVGCEGFRTFRVLTPAPIFRVCWWFGKVPLQACSGPEDSRKLRFPDFMTTAQGGGKVFSLTYRPHLPAGSSPGTHFC